jgi:hypothetical protein
MQSRRLFGTAMKQQCQSRKLRRLEQENFFLALLEGLGKINNAIQIKEIKGKGR